MTRAHEPKSARIARPPHVSDRRAQGFSVEGARSTRSAQVELARPRSDSRGPSVTVSRPSCGRRSWP